MSEVLIPILGIIFGVGGPVLLAALCFPSIRSAVADRLRGDAHIEASDPEVVAQIAALRGEIYALRTEVAVISRALPGVSPQAGQLRG